MIIKENIERIERLIKNKQSFIVCTFYIDSFSMIYSTKLNKELNKNKIKIYYL